jgi:serine-type D-Ala-D-Ala carboxypeptidase/endopeptidase (penicillin-binding protein 4)
VLRIYGTIAVDSQADEEEVAIDDPAEYAAAALKVMLEVRGIAVTGVARAKHRQASYADGFTTRMSAPGQEQAVVSGAVEGGSCLQTSPDISDKVVATHVSVPLREDVVVTNKVSQNLHAELLLHRLGRRTLCGDGSTVAGARLVRAFLEHAGIDKEDFVFFDGSGLSGHDLVTPRATARLLQFASGQPWFADWKKSLPVGGEDGSLAGRFPKAPLKDHVFAKTGTLGEARALSGYLECASGKTVIFSIMVGNHAPRSNADRDAMDQVVAAIAAAN